LDLPEKVKGHKKISEIPDVPKAIANLTIPLLTTCRKREFPLPEFVYPIDPIIRASVFLNMGAEDPRIDMTLVSD